MGMNGAMPCYSLQCNGKSVMEWSDTECSVVVKWVNMPRLGKNLSTAQYECGTLF